MPVVTLAALIVIPHDSDPIDHIDKPIFVTMPGWRNGFWYTPNHAFNPAIAVGLLELMDKHGLYIIYRAPQCMACKAIGMHPVY